MNAVARRVLLILPEASTLRHLRTVLATQGWQVDEHPTLEPFCLRDCAAYQVVIIQPSGVGAGEEQIHALLANCEEYDSAMVLPILDSPTAAGVVRLMRDGVVDVLSSHFSDRELIDTVNRVAGHRNLYLENLAYSEQLEKANRELKGSLNILRMDHVAGRQVQKSLLPISPLEHGEYTVAHRINPSLYLSGDFVGYSTVLDRFLIFYLADVSGHGASSAFVTILLHFILKRILRRHTYEKDIEALLRAPEGFLEHLNRQIMAAGLEKYLTMFAGSIDLDTNILRYSVAAQMPMPVLVTGDDARFLAGKGKPVGMFENATWQVEEIVLPANFSLYAISDGLMETLPGPTLEAKEDYFRTMAANCAGNHEVLCESLGLNDSGNVPDDISLLSVIRRSKS